MEKNPFEYGNLGFSRQPARQESNFDQLEATELYCVRCGRSVPVRKSLLLVLPEGDKYEYRCQYCGATVGDKIDHSGRFQGIFKG
jgi:DNA-directed RNA polymerase subunit RPC12/RpoP